MILLVDYDNIRPIDRNRGLAYVIEKTIRAIGTAAFTSSPRARVRLYGGWHMGSQRSRLAQKLAAEVSAGFSRVVVATDAGSSIKVTTNVELAYSLECDPRSVLPSTFRVRGAPENLRPKPLPYSGCHQPSSCALTVIHSFLANSACPQHGCTVSIDAVVERAEQKLVDGMITTDFLHLSTRAKEPIAIVSSDDDLWPAIHGAVIYGADVYHVQTHTGRITPTHYSSLVSGRYSQFTI